MDRMNAGAEDTPATHVAISHQRDSVQIVLLMVGDTGA